ncbi:MAG: hypothetical protein VYA54_08900 [Bdellovibrionota bacterium]|nr:hypothetical protein [Bdellovibrionota bacterium]
MQNHINNIPEDIQSTYFENYDVFIDEMKSLSKADLQVTLNELNKICLDFDPYQPHEISDDVKVLIAKFKLDEMLGNPFTFTNNLLKILTAVETEFKLR